MERDRIVFDEVRKRGIPIVMVTSGGYQVSNATASNLWEMVGLV